MIEPIILVIISFLAMIILVKLVSLIAYKFNFLDDPDGNRKKHQKPTPYLGGLAIVLTFLMMEFIVGFSFELPIYLGMLGYLTLGMIDDKFDMKARYKLYFQVLIAILVIYFVDISISEIRFVGFALQLTELSQAILMVSWIILLVNAINLIDGMDGLAGGISLIIISTYIIISLLSGTIIFPSLYILVGTLLGFLLYNLPKATIFLGDNGSMILGYLIAVISISTYKTATIISFSVVVLIMSLILIDVMLSILRRLKSGKSIFGADDRHFHHRLLKNKKLTEVQTLMVLYLITVVYSSGAILLTITTFRLEKILVYSGILLFTIIVIENLFLVNEKNKILKRIILKIKGIK